MGRGRPLAELVLSVQENNQLVEWTRRGKPSQALALRARIVLACARVTTNGSTAALKQAIRDYLAIHNKNPKPFCWTKSADDILASLARFCKRISDSQHKRFSSYKRSFRSRHYLVA